MKTLDERLYEVQLQVHHLSRHVERVIATSNELEEACGGRPFAINGFAAWDALLSVRDGIFLDLVSWSKSLYMAGGLFKSIAGADFQALAVGSKRRFKDEDPWLQKWMHDRRVELFTDLFPKALERAEVPATAKPTLDDVLELADRVAKSTDSIEQNRHRVAHRYNEDRTEAAEFRLDLDQLIAVSRDAQELVNKLRVLCSGSSFGFPRMARDHKDHEIRDLVDLALFGSRGQIEMWSNHLGPFRWPDERVIKLRAWFHTNYDPPTWRAFNDFTAATSLIPPRSAVAAF